MSDALLEVKELRTVFHTEDGVVTAVDGISFDIRSGETVGIVGESGCGKSVTSLSIMRLVPDPPGRIADGQILMDGEDLLRKSEKEMRHIRGNEVSMIFQEPMTSLNPVYTVGDQIAESIRLHQGMNKRDSLKMAEEMLALVGIPSPEERVHQYPHQLSGGMRQRVMIAMALSCNPKLLIADEPTTALDVTIQAQILQLMKDLKSRIGSAILLITHDLGVVADMCDRVIVMYAGKIIEQSEVDDLFSRPYHPYTEGLLQSIPKLNQPKGSRLNTIEGTVPDPNHMPSGCRFHPRCPYATDECRAEEPPLESVGDGRLVACWHWSQLAEKVGEVT